MSETHAKILKTKHALLDALCALAETHSAKDISVAELCRKANINRTTFYKYYSIPMDIIVESVNSITTKLFEQFQRNTNYAHDRRLYDRMLGICQVYYDNKWMMKIYLAFTNDLFALTKRQFDTFETHSISDSSMYYFISGGVASLLAQWMMQGYREPPRHVAEILTKYIIRMRDIG